MRSRSSSSGTALEQSNSQAQWKATTQTIDAASKRWRSPGIRQQASRSPISQTNKVGLSATVVCVFHLHPSEPGHVRSMASRWTSMLDRRARPNSNRLGAPSLTESYQASLLRWKKPSSFDTSLTGFVTLSLGQPAGPRRLTRRRANRSESALSLSIAATSVDLPQQLGWRSLQPSRQVHDRAQPGISRPARSSSDTSVRCIPTRSPSASCEPACPAAQRASRSATQWTSYVERRSATVFLVVAREAEPPLRFCR